MIIDQAIQAREENPEMKERFRLVFTSAGDPLDWGEKIKGAGSSQTGMAADVEGA
jgi:hypothetical protein